MKGRSGKTRKTKSRGKAVKAARGRSSKSKKASKIHKASRAATKHKTARKRAPARKKASTKTRSRASGRGPVRTDVFGEGNYTASREFRRQETGFVQRNRNRIPQMGEEAAEALDGGEGKDLRRAEETARSHSAGDEDEGPAASRR